MEALLNAALPGDVSRAVRYYRSRVSARLFERRLLGLSSVLGVGRLASEIRRARSRGLDGMLDRAGWWLGQPPALSEWCVQELREALAGDQTDVFRTSS